MAFPTSISGNVIIRDDQVPPSFDPFERLYAALKAETVDQLEHSGNRLTFTGRHGIHSPMPRPGGQSWLFAIFDSGRFEVARNLGGITVQYELSTRRGFLIVTALALAVATLIQSSSGPGHQWGWAVGCGIWTAVFASSFASKAIEVRRWIKNIMTSGSLPPSAELRLDEL